MTETASRDINGSDTALSVDDREQMAAGTSGKDLFGGGIGCQPAAASQLMLGLIYLFSPRSLSNPLYAHTKGWRPQGQLQKGKK